MNTNAADLSRQDSSVKPFVGRLEQLVQTSRRSLWRAAVVCGLPLAGMLGGIGSFALIDTVEMSPWWQGHFANAGDSAMKLGYAIFYLPLFLLSLVIGILITYFILEYRFHTSYRLARSILQNTEVPVLIADGQVLAILAGQGPSVLEMHLPDTAAARQNAEDQLKLAAAYLQPLHAYAQSSDQAQAGKSRNLRRFLSPVRMLAYKVGSLLSGMTLGCPYNFGLSCLLGPPLVAVAQVHGLPFAEYLGNLKAICEHMLAELMEREA